MKYLIGLLLLCNIAYAGPAREPDMIIKNTLSVGSNTTPNSKSILDLVSTTKGFLAPRMDNTARNAITSPPEGLLIYNTTTDSFDIYNGSGWETGATLSNTGTFTNKTWNGVTIAVANGGTGLTAGTSGGILGYTASGTLASSGALTANQLIKGGGAGVTPSTFAACSDGEIIKYASGVPACGADTTGAGAVNYRLLTSVSDSPTTADDGFVKMTGASWNLVIHTAVSNTGQILEIKHDGTSLTQVYCFTTTSGEVFITPQGNVASGDYCHYTKGETSQFKSNGANWELISHYAKTAEADAGPLVISASSAHSFTISSATINAGTTYTTPNGCKFIVSTNLVAGTTLLAYGTCNPDAATNTLTYVSGPTSGNRTYTAVSNAGKPVYATATFNRFLWYRDGSDAVVRWEGAFTTVGTAGTGDHLFFLPDNLLPDETNMFPQTAVLGAGYPVAFSSLLMGHSFGSSVPNFSHAFLAWPGTLKAATVGNSTWSAGSYTITTANSRFSMQGRYPVIGWRP